MLTNLLNILYKNGNFTKTVTAETVAPYPPYELPEDGTGAFYFITLTPVNGGSPEYYVYTAPYGYAYHVVTTNGVKLAPVTPLDEYFNTTAVGAAITSALILASESGEPLNGPSYNYAATVALANITPDNNTLYTATVSYIGLVPSSQDTSLRIATYRVTASGYNLINAVLSNPTIETAFNGIW